MHDTQSKREVHDRAVILQSAPTYAEYLQANPCTAPMLRARQQEIRLAPDDQVYLCLMPNAIHMVVVASPDSPSTLAVVPVLARLARTSPRISFWVLDAEAGIDLVQQLVNESDIDQALSSRELPLLVLFDTAQRYLGHWGPHPAGFASQMNAWLSRHPDRGTLGEIEASADPPGRCPALRKELTYEMCLWYNSGLNQACVAEVRSLLESVQDESVPEDVETPEDELRDGQ